MSAVTNVRNQPMLNGLFVPVTDERDDRRLPVTGDLPAGLQGALVRVGPNPMFEPLGRYHMFDGDGMLHAVTFDDGEVSYRNRWIRTAGLEAEQRAGRALYGGLGDLHMPGPDEVGDAGPMKNLANTNIVRHAGRRLALWEAGPPTEFTAELDTVGVWDFDGRLDGAFTAHPKIDPRTGEMLAFAYLPSEPYLKYFQIGADGTLERTVDIDLPEAIVMHDFAITEHYAVFVDAPMVLDIMAALHGEPMFRWNPDHVTRVGLLPRDGDTVTWYETEASYINHFWNAWEDGDTVTFAGSRLAGEAYTAGKDGAMDREGADADPGLPTRFTVDTATGSVHVEQFDDLGGDYPRINDAYCGVRSRYHYMGGFRGSGRHHRALRHGRPLRRPDRRPDDLVVRPERGHERGRVRARPRRHRRGRRLAAGVRRRPDRRLHRRGRVRCPRRRRGPDRPCPPAPARALRLPRQLVLVAGPYRLAPIGPNGGAAGDQKALVLPLRPSDAHDIPRQGAESCQKQTRAALPLDGPCSQRRCCS